MRCKDGIVLGVEKLVESKLLVKQSNRRINTADLHVGVVRRAPQNGTLFRAPRPPRPRRPSPGLNLGFRRPTHQATAGLLADGRALVALARSQAEQYRDFYKTPIPGKVLADRMALHVQAYTLYSSVRPYGASVLVAVVDRKEPQLYMIEPSGTYYVRRVPCPAPRIQNCSVLTGPAPFLFSFFSIAFRATLAAPSARASSSHGQRLKSSS